MSNLITPVAILSYPYLFKPRAPMAGASNQDPQYQATLVFPPGTDLKVLSAAAKECAREKWGDKGEEVYRKAKHPTFRTDATDKGYADGSVYIQIKSKTAPGIVDRYKDPVTGKPRIITDPNEMYAGCQVRASVRAFAYDANGNKGVSFSLQNIQKVGDGERLDGRKKADEEFEGEAPEAADDLL